MTMESILCILIYLIIIMNLEAHWRNCSEVTDIVNKRAGTQVLVP